MIKYIVAAFLLISSFAYTQTQDSTEYFSVGVYGGRYIYPGRLTTANSILNSVSAELEYRKTKDFSFFANVIYQFTKSDLKSINGNLNIQTATVLENPFTCNGVVTFGGRYYLSSKKVNTYVTLGLSQQFEYIGNYSYIPEALSFMGSGTNNGFTTYRISIMAGTGINFQLSRKLLLDFQFNVFRNIEKDYGNFSGTNYFLGLKYNLF